MAEQATKAATFLSLHIPGEPLLLPNPWDVGSARVLATLGFRALATTSAGHAHTLGRLDGGVTRDEALAHAAEIVNATELPVSADFENGFADDPDGVAESVQMAATTGLAGLSIEDYTGDPYAPFYELSLATERVAAAVEAAGPSGMVITARAENFVRANPDFDDTMTRLQAFQDAGAHVLYAPWMSDRDHIRSVTSSVDAPVNVLARPGGPSVPELADMGVARVSVGGAFHLVTLAALEDASVELRDQGTYSWFEQAKRGVAVRDAAFE